MNLKHETRTITGAQFRTTEKGEIVGYALKFDEYSQNLGGFVEIIRPGALDGVLENSDVRALFNHDPNLPLGRAKVGNLELTIDDVGLLYRITPDQSVTYVKDLMTNIRNGVIDQSSFAFDLTHNGYEYYEDDERGTVKEITQFKRLYDVSPVTYPAYHTTEVSMRSLENYNKSKEVPPAPAPTKRKGEYYRRKILILENEV